MHVSWRTTRVDSFDDAINEWHVPTQYLILKCKWKIIKIGGGQCYHFWNDLATLNWLVILTFRSNVLLPSSESKCLEWRCLIFIPSSAVPSSYYPASFSVTVTLKMEASSWANIWPKYSLPHCCLLLRRFVVHTSTHTPGMVTGSRDLSEPSTHLTASLHFNPTSLAILLVVPFDTVESKYLGVTWVKDRRCSMRPATV